MTTTTEQPICIHRRGKAKKEVYDEYYTKYEDIFSEMLHYKDLFAGKVVYCPADDPLHSNFVNYFSDNFIELKLKKLIATNYKHIKNTNSSEPSVFIKENGKTTITPLRGKGDFRNIEVSKYWEEADIIVTNPPFSLLTDFFNKIQELHKDFIIIAPLSSITYKSFGAAIQAKKLWAGANKRVRHYLDGDGKDIDMSNTVWLTNMVHDRLKVNKLSLNTMKFNIENNAMVQNKPDNYKFFDNAPDIMEVAAVSAIPSDYFGRMAVPVTYLSDHNPEQIDLICNHSQLPGVDSALRINGKAKFLRLIIKLKGEK